MRWRRGGLRRMYVGTLTLSLFLAVFGAVLLAVLLGNQLARPLLVLAEGVREVAAGNLSPKAALPGQGRTWRSDPVICHDDAAAGRCAGGGGAKHGQGRCCPFEPANHSGQPHRRGDRAGEGGIIRSSNPGATRILRAPMAAYEGRPLSEVPGLADFAAAVERHFLAFFGDRDRHGLDHWQQPFELHASSAGAGQHATSLVARGAELPDGSATVGF